MKRIQIWKKKLGTIALTILVYVLLTSPVFAAESFIDVPADHWAAVSIEELHALGYSDGIGEQQFGLGQTITRAQFAAFVTKVMELGDGTEPQAYTDNTEPNAWYYATLNAIAANRVTNPEGAFRPNDPITRAEMTEMMMGALGFYDLGKQLDTTVTSPFTDVNERKGFIALAYDLGLASGMGNQQFDPNATATREQAAAMLVRLHHTKEQQLSELHGFYAISSASQKDYIPALDSTGFGWARLSLQNGQIFLNTTASNDNEYYIPKGFLEPFWESHVNDGKALLSIYADNTNGILSQILSNADLRTEAVSAIVSAMHSSGRDFSTVTFDGIVLDFETLRNTQKDNYTAFLQELRYALGDAPLYVAVHPVMTGSYYDGYDYAQIGILADRVILMAYDFDTQSLTEEEKAIGYTMTPLSPLNQVYVAIQACLKGGIPEEKLLLGISIDSNQWKLKDGVVTHSTPYHPPYEAIIARLNSSDCQISFPNYSYNPYIRYWNESDGTENIIWYENEQSVAAKAELARLCELRGISIWRMGLIPTENAHQLNIWKTLINHVE